MYSSILSKVISKFGHKTSFFPIISQNCNTNWRCQSIVNCYLFKFRMYKFKTRTFNIYDFTVESKDTMLGWESISGCDSESYNPGNLIASWVWKWWNFASHGEKSWRSFVFSPSLPTWKTDVKNNALLEKLICTFRCYFVLRYNLCIYFAFDV